MYDLGLYVGWFEILHDFIGLPGLYGLKYDGLTTSWLLLYLCSYKLDGSIIVPRTIISDRGPWFMAHFWEHLHKQLGTNLVRSFAYHPHIAMQTKHVNQILEDMLRACVLSSKGLWEK
jgi:hypothetical protein